MKLATSEPEKKNASPTQKIVREDDAGAMTAEMFAYNGIVMLNGGITSSMIFTECEAVAQRTWYVTIRKQFFYSEVCTFEETAGWWCPAYRLEVQYCKPCRTKL